MLDEREGFGLSTWKCGIAINKMGNPVDETDWMGEVGNLVFYV